MGPNLECDLAKYQQARCNGRSGLKTVVDDEAELAKIMTVIGLS